MNGTYYQSPERQQPVPGPVATRLEKTHMGELFINAAFMTYGPEYKAPAPDARQRSADPDMGKVVPLHPGVVAPNDEKALRIEQAQQNVEDSYNGIAA